MKNSVLTTSLLIAALALVQTTGQAQSKPTERSKTNRASTTQSSGITSLHVQVEGDNDEHQKITYTRNGEEYRIVMEDDKITDLQIDGKKIPPADWPKYEPQIRELLEKLKKDREEAARRRAEAEVYRKQAEVARKEAEEQRKLAEKHREKAMQDRERAEQYRQEAAKHQLEAERDRVQAKQQREQVELQRKQIDLARQEAEKQRQLADKMREKAEQDRAKAEELRQEATRMREQAESNRALAEKEREKAEVRRKQAEEDRQLVEAFLDELVNEKIVDSREKLRQVTLSSESLTVNGQQQSPALHQQFKSKYLKTPGARINYRYDAESRSISVEKND